MQKPVFENIIYSIVMYIFTSLLHQLYCSVKLCGRDHTKPFLKGLCQLFIYVIHQPGGPYWEKLCPTSWILPEAVGREQYPRQRAQFFPIRTDLVLVNNIFSFFLKPIENLAERTQAIKSYGKILHQLNTFLASSLYIV